MAHQRVRLLSALSSCWKKSPSETAAVPLAELIDDRLLDAVLERSKDAAGGLRLTGENSMLGELVKAVLERALGAELTAHLGYGRHDPAGNGSGNSRNGTIAKTVQTVVGPVAHQVPRDRAGTFDPVLVPKRSGRIAGQVCDRCCARGPGSGYPRAGERFTWAMSSRSAGRAAARSSACSSSWRRKSMTCCSSWVIFWLSASRSAGTPSPDSCQVCSPSVCDRCFSSCRTRPLSRVARSWAPSRSACRDARPQDAWPGRADRWRR